MTEQKVAEFLLELVAQNKFAAAIIVAAWVLIRLLSADVGWFPTLPAVLTLPLVGWQFQSKRLKPVLVVSLAALGFAVEHLMLGVRWQDALKKGFVMVATPLVFASFGFKGPAADASTAPAEASRATKLPPMPVLLLTFVALLAPIQGCIGTFDGPHGEFKVAPITPEQRDRCDGIDRNQLIWGSTTAILAGAAGANGLTAFKVQKDGTREVLILVAGGAGLAALGTTFIWNHYTKKYVAEGCGQ